LTSSKYLIEVSETVGAAQYHASVVQMGRIQSFNATEHVVFKALGGEVFLQQEIVVEVGVSIKVVYNVLARLMV